MEPNIASAALARSLDPEGYHARAQEASVLMQSSIERRRLEEEEGVEMMLFCMGPLSLRTGQHIGICLFEPRYRLMVRNALSTHGGRFGIIVDDGGIRTGAEGRTATIIFERQRPDGSYDVVVQVRLARACYAVASLSYLHPQRAPLQV